MPHTSSQRPALGIMFVLISCSSLQFGAAFAVTLFPLFGDSLQRGADGSAQPAAAGV